MPPASPALDQVFDSGSLFSLRAAVAAHTAASGLSQRRVYDAVAAAHELAANAVQHGAGHGRLRLWTEGTFLFCQVSDDGPVTPANESQDGAAVPVTWWPAGRGHGLWVVRQVSDQVGVDHGPGGTVVTIAFTTV
jgi:anti-sigma regulatory factor (Ser/Thr protein kinase)